MNDHLSEYAVSGRTLLINIKSLRRRWVRYLKYKKTVITPFLKILCFLPEGNPMKLV